MRQWKGRSLPDSSQPDSNSYGQTTCCFFRCSLPYFHFRKNSVVLFSSHGIKNWFLLWDLTVGFHDEWPIIPWLLNGIMWDFPIFHGGFWILSGCYGGPSTQVQMGTTTPDFHRMEARDIQMPEDSRLEAVNAAVPKNGERVIQWSQWLRFSGEFWWILEGWDYFFDGKG